MKINRIIIITLFILLSCGDSPSRGNHLSALGFYSSPGKIISSLDRESDSYREQFMLGCAHSDLKNYKSAILHFANSAFKSCRSFDLKLYPQPVYKFLKGFHIRSEYYDDAVYEIARLFYLYREHLYVTRYTELISDNHRGLYRDALILKAKSLTAMKKYPHALEVLKNALDRYRDRGSRSLIYIRIASVYENMDNTGRAIDAYFSVLSEGTSGWQAAIACRRIMAIGKSGLEDLPDSMKITLAKGLFNAGDYPAAALIAGELKHTKHNTGPARILIRSLVRAGKQASADRILSANKGNPALYSELLKAEADELWSMGHSYRAVPIYRNIFTGPDGPHTGDSLRRIASWYEDRRLPGYDRYINEYISRYPEDRHTEEFLWLLARNRLREKRLPEAEKLMSTALDKFPRGQHSDRHRYWLYKLNASRGISTMSLKFAREAVVINPDSSYTWRMLSALEKQFTMVSLRKLYSGSISTGDKNGAMLSHVLLFMKEKDFSKRNRRLKKLGLDYTESYINADRTLSDMVLSSPCSKDLENIEKYFQTGYERGINRELAIVPDTRPARKDRAVTLAHLGKKYGNHYYSVFYTLDYLDAISLKENIAVMPENTALNLYPRAFSDSIDRYAAQYGIDSRVIYSLIKAESLFNPDAESPAGAAGLMQLMPATAREIAGDLGVKSYRLKDPDTSIRFGTKYIAWLEKYFRGNLTYMVAGYNAGAGNVNKWRRRTVKDDDYFTEFVPYSETRNYILRTGKFLTQYRILYGK